MKCPYCLEEIIDGATVCRFCGKKQPLTAEAKEKRRERRTPIVILSVLGVIGLIMVWANLDYQHEQALLQAAATCNGSLTADQLEASAHAAAKASGMSEVEAQHAAEVLACPNMANN